MAQQKITLDLIGQKELPRFVHLLSNFEANMIMKSKRSLGLGVSILGIPCGIAVLEFDKSTAYLQTIFVVEEYRRRGAGTELLEAMKTFCKKTGHQLICVFSSYGAGSDVYGFFAEQRDFSLVRGQGYEISANLEDMKNTPIPAINEAKEIVPFFDLNRFAYNSFLAKLSDRGYFISDEISIDRSSFIGSMCLCHMQGSSINTACFVRQRKKDIEISFIYAEHGGERAMMKIISLIKQQCISRFESCGDSEARLRMTLINSASQKIVKRLFTNYEITGRMYSAVYLGNEI